MDFNLQMRFWRGVTDAMFHSADAALAAAAAWQDEALSKNSPPKRAVSPTPAANPMMWPWWPMANAWMTPPAPPPPAPVTPFSMFTMMPFAADFWKSAGTAMPMTQLPMMQLPMTQLPMMQPPMMTAFSKPNPFWPWPMAWASMQFPLTMMMVSAGVPYSVASPSAKASTAAMDAAQAAREQMEKVYSAYRSDGGHAAAQLVSLPLTMAVSFMGNEPQKPSGFGW